MEVKGGGAKCGGDCAMLTPKELVFTFGVLTPVLILVKIDKERRPRECAQTDTQTH